MTNKEARALKRIDTPEEADARAAFWARSAQVTAALAGLDEAGLDLQLLGETLFVVARKGDEARPLSPRDVPRDLWRDLRQVLRDAATRAREAAAELKTPGWSRGATDRCYACCAPADTYHDRGGGPLPACPPCVVRRREKEQNARAHAAQVQAMLAAPPKLRKSRPVGTLAAEKARPAPTTYDQPVPAPERDRTASGAPQYVRVPPRPVPAASINPGGNP